MNSPPPYYAYEPFPLPPADDSRQQQSGESVVREESIVRVKPKRQRSICAVLINVLNVITLLLVVVTGLASLAVFSTKENQIRSESTVDDDETRYCILFAENTSGQLSLGNSHPCNFVIYGEAFVCFFAAAVILFAGIRIWMGKWCDTISNCACRDHAVIIYYKHMPSPAGSHAC